MYSSCKQRKKDFSKYVIIKNFITRPFQQALSRQELHEVVTKMWNIGKFRFQDDSTDEYWTTAFADFKDRASAEAAVGYLNAKDSLSAGFISPIFDMYDEKENKLKRIFHDMTFIVVRQKNYHLSQDYIGKFFSTYGEIKEFAFGETTFIGYEYFSQALSAEVDNNKWDDNDFYLSVDVLRNFKEYVLGFLVVVEDFMKYDNPNKGTEHVSSSTTPNIAATDGTKESDFSDELITVLERRALLINPGNSSFLENGLEKFNHEFEAQLENHALPEEETKHAGSKEIWENSTQTWETGENSKRFKEIQKTESNTKADNACQRSCLPRKLQGSSPYETSVCSEGNSHGNISGACYQSYPEQYGYTHVLNQRYQLCHDGFGCVSSANLGAVEYDVHPMIAEYYNRYAHKYKFRPVEKSPTKQGYSAGSDGRDTTVTQ